MHRVRFLTTAVLFSAAAMGGAFTALKVSAGERHFMRAACMDHMAEIKLGQLAMNRGNSKFVRDFGKRMAKDHGVALQELRQLARAEKTALPKSVNLEQRATYRHLSGLRGDAFDNAYKMHMMEGHQKALALFKGTARKATNSNVKNYATKYAPIVEMHYTMLKDGKMDM